MIIAQKDLIRVSALWNKRGDRVRKKKRLFIVGMLVLVLFYSIPFFNTRTITNQSKQYLVSSSDIEAKSGMFVDASLEFGVPASILIAMAIEETSFGTKGVAISLNNWFGMEKSSLYHTLHLIPHY